MAPKTRLSHSHSNDNNETYDKIDLTKATASKKKSAKRVLDARIINENTLQQLQPLTQKQQEMFELFLSSDQQLLAIGSAGTGKAQPLYSKILTPTGWTTMGEIQPHDKIVAADGTVCKVLQTFPQDGVRPVYEIEFHDGSKTRCDEDHLWDAWIPDGRKKTHKHTISLKQLMMQHTFWTNRPKNSKINISIDLCEPVEKPTKQLLIPPYTLGALLGDGCISNINRVPCFASNDQEIIDKLSIESAHLFSLKPTTSCDYNLYGIGDGKRAPIVDLLSDMGLMGTFSHTKFIPDQYVNGSIEQRWELIRGLFDTDGTVDKRGGISYSTTSMQLAKQIQEIIWSLGGTCSISTRHSFYRDKDTREKTFGRVSYNLNVRHKHPKQFFYLSRKVNRAIDVHSSGRIQLRRRIKHITFVGYEQTKCILIDHPDHLYITDDYIVTHNTAVALYLALKDILITKKHKRIIILRSPMSVNSQGFLPGSLEEKEAVYERPYVDIVNWLFDHNDAYSELKDAGIIQFMTTSYIRGLTWNDSIIIADEVQNMLWEEINTIATRTGNYSRLIFLGDAKQDDIKVSKRYQESGIEKLLKVAYSMKQFSVLEFMPSDIVRNELVKSWIIACELNKL